MKAATDAKGRPTAWLQRSVFPPIGSQGDVAARYGGSMGWLDIPYDIPNFRSENGPAEAHVRIGWLRSVANIYHAYGVCSFIDELAAAAGRDRVEYLLEALGTPRIIDIRPPNLQSTSTPFLHDTARTRRVLEMVAEQSGWAKKKPGNGRALGIAVHRSFFSYVASVVEVELLPNGRIRIPRVDTVVDAGKIVSPDRVRAQFEGAAVFGAGVAMMGEITASNGRITQSNFHNYKVPRINEAPSETHVTIVASDAAPAGVGEPGVPPIAPAICNALFAITGKRFRELPLSKQNLA
jgi:isoquinoline 1-oxidoreductase beta subunit